MNISIISGRLVKDPELVHSKDGYPSARATLAVNYFEKGEQKAYFIPLIFFDKNATNIAQWGHKGTYLLIHGALSTNTYTKQDGSKASSWNVIVNRYEMLNDGVPKIDEKDRVQGDIGAVYNEPSIEDFEDPFKSAPSKVTVNNGALPF